MHLLLHHKVFTGSFFFRVWLEIADSGATVKLTELGPAMLIGELTDDAFGRLIPNETCKAYGVSNRNPILKVNIVLEVIVVTRRICGCYVHPRFMFQPTSCDLKVPSSHCTCLLPCRNSMPNQMHG